MRMHWHKIHWKVVRLVVKRRIGDTFQESRKSSHVNFEFLVKIYTDVQISPGVQTNPD